jgi:hypothetical protein
MYSRILVIGSNAMIYVALNGHKARWSRCMRKFMHGLQRSKREDEVENVGQRENLRVRNKSRIFVRKGGTGTVFRADGKKE